MPKPPPKPPTTARPRLKPAAGPRRYRGDPELAEEASDPGDRVQGSDGKPVTGQQ